MRYREGDEAHCGDSEGHPWADTQEEGKCRVRESNFRLRRRFWLEGLGLQGLFLTTHPGLPGSQTGTSLARPGGCQERFPSISSY